MVTAIDVFADAIPAALRQRRQWVLWKLETGSDGKPNKTPYSTDEQLAKSNDPQTWASFADAVARFNLGGFSGIGYVFAADDPFVGIDLDGCRDPETGSFAPWAKLWVDRFATYTEVSPSGTGCKLWLRGKNPLGSGKKRNLDGEPIHGKTPGVELYDRGRYFCVTGATVRGTPATIEPDNGGIAEFIRAYFPDRHANGAASNAATGPTRHELMERCWKYVSKMPDAVSGSGGHNSTFSAACECFRFGLTDGEAREILGRFNDAKTGGEPWRPAELEHKLTGAREQVTASGEFGCRLRERRNGRAAKTAHGGGNGTAGKPVGQTGGLFALTDTGLAERFARQHGGDVRYCFAWGKWLCWDGMRWRVDDAGVVEQLSKSTVRRLVGEAEEAGDDRRQALLKFAARSEDATRRAACLRLARSEPPIPVLPEALDTDQWLLNCQNGSVNLQTGALLPHRREDLVTCLCPTRFDPTATAPRWERFLAEIMCGCTPLVEFLQRLFGYALTGVVRDQVFPIFWGSGSNGKSTLLSTIKRVMGPDYTIQSPTDLFMTQNGQQHPTGLATLYRKRLAIAIETDESRRLAEGTIKQLTGGDDVACRRMREDYWQYSPTHKLILGCNHQPRITGTDWAIWRRIRLVPFTVTVPDNEQDTDLPEKLAAEAEGILAWCVRGCLVWQRDGLGTTEQVDAATAQYRGREDSLAGFLEERCEVWPGGTSRAKDLLDAYREWSGDKRMGARRFGLKMTERGFERFTNNGICYRGVSLTEG